MNKLIGILGLAVIPVLSPLTGQAQQTSDLNRSHFTIGKLSTREKGNYTYVDGEITNNAKKAARAVSILIRWFDKNNKVIATDSTSVSDLAPGETLPFEADTRKNPEITRHEVTVKHAY